MIDHDKYKGHTRNLIALPPVQASAWVIRNKNIEDRCAGYVGEAVNEPDAHLFADAPLILARLKEVEEENAALIHDNADYVKSASELATENVVLRGTLRDVEVLLRAERHNHVTHAAYDNTGSTIANCINIISQALNKAKGGSK